MIETVAVFERKPDKLQHTKCVIEKMVELPQEEYWQFFNNLSDEQTFIKENNECMYQDELGKRHCLLVLGKGIEDGILVEAQGYSYARYAALLPNARTAWNMEQYPVLKKQYENAISVNEYYTQEALTHQQDGMYRILVDDVFSEITGQYLTKSLLEDMMQDNPNFEHAELIDDEIFITLAEQPSQEDGKKSIKELTSQEVEIMLAKHVLWLHDAGGEQADFSNCEIYDMDLESYRLDQAIFKNAVIRNTSLRCAEMQGTDFENALFQVCDISHTIPEDANFKGARFKVCDLQATVFKNCNMKDARFFQVATNDCRMNNCCIENVKIRNDDSQKISWRECSRDESEWQQESADIGISM